MQVSHLHISVFELVGGDYQEVAERAMVELVEKQLKTAPEEAFRPGPQGR